MNPISRFVSWLLSLSDGGDVSVPAVYAGTGRRRYARGTCARCNKSLAMTKDGRLWPHTCNGVDTHELDAHTRDLISQEPSR